MSSQQSSIRTDVDHLDEVAEANSTNKNVDKIIIDSTPSTAVSSWLPWNWRWKPTSLAELEDTEREILKASGVSFEQSLLKVTSADDKTPVYINTVKAGQGPPLLLLHGFGAGIGFWVGNLAPFSKENTVYAIDLIGFGRSTRHSYTGQSIEEAEEYFVSMIEKWRVASKIEGKINVLGHSFGGYLASLYSLKHPEHVNRLILADPWGVPKRPEDAMKNVPFRWKVVSSVLTHFNPLATVRAAGPYGPTLVSRFRSDIPLKFVHLFQDRSDIITRYIYHLNAQDPMGEQAFAALTTGFAWAANPLIDRLPHLNPNIKVSMLYGDKTWMDVKAGYYVKQQLGDRASFHVVQNAGHHLYIDNHKDFNHIVTRELRGQ